MLYIKNIENDNLFFYSVKLNMKCEECENEFKRIDNFFYHERKTKKFFDEFYEGDNIDNNKCNSCGLFMYPEEIININEHLVKGYLENLGLYINSKNRIIPTNSMQLIGITIEGTNENDKCEAIIMDLSEENYKKIWNHGKKLWDDGYISKYIICLFENNKCFGYVRPDKENFEVCRRLDNYMKNNELLEIYNNNQENDYFLINSLKNEILEFYNVEEKLLDYPIERGNSFEI